MTDAGVLSGRKMPFGGVSREPGRSVVRGTSAVPAVLVLAGLILPPEMGVSAGGVALTPGRIGILLLFLPALAVFFRRRRLWTDFFVVATVSWMVGAAVSVSGIKELWSAPGGESLEFFGSYVIARAYFFGPGALDKFLRVLRFLSVVVIMMAVAEFMSGRLILRDTVAAIVGAKSATASAIFRYGMIRAVSTFEHPILFGSFCPLLLTLMLYWERSALRRILWVSLCLAGTIASITSIALLSLFVAVGLFTYDHLMNNYRWRWKVIWAFLTLVFSALFLISNAPFGWLITHLTFDPESGYFRFLIWDAALTYIEQAPLTGYAYNLLHHDILDTTVDSVWLVTSLRYGVPAVIFLFLANVTAFLPLKTSRNISVDLNVMKMSTAFTIVLILFVFDGLTVHYWNFLWIFWGVCIGIRVSLRELSLTSSVNSSAIPI